MVHYLGDVVECVNCKFGMNGNGLCKMTRGVGYGCKKGRPISDNVPKISKFKNRRCTFDGYNFDSEFERDRYQSLKFAQQTKVITELIVKPKYTLIVNNITIGNYTPDFQYVKNGELIVEDVKCKATCTTDYKLRKKLMKALFNIDVIEVYK